MTDERKSVAVKFTEQQNQAVEKWMSEASCSRQVAIIGMLVKGAKSLGVWSDEPHVRASHSVRLPNNVSNGSNSTVGGNRSTEGTIDSVTEKNNTIPDNFSEFWYSIPKQFKRGTREEARKKWNAKKVLNEIRKSGLTPTDVADRYVEYFKANKGEGYEGIRYVKHVSNWLDAFGFHDEVVKQVDVEEVYVDRDWNDVELEGEE